MSKVQLSEANQVKRLIDNGATFMFVPYSNLVEMVVKAEHPLVKSMPYAAKYIIMQNRPIRIEGEMALNYYLGKMDIKNSFVLDRGDIKVIPERFKAIKIEEKE